MQWTGLASCCLCPSRLWLLRFLKKIWTRFTLRNKLIKTIVFSHSGEFKFKMWQCTSVFPQHHKLIKIGPSAFPASFLLLLPCAGKDCAGSWFRKLNWLKTSNFFFFLVELVFNWLGALNRLILQLHTCQWLCEQRGGIWEREGKSGTGEAWRCEPDVTGLQLATYCFA